MADTAAVMTIESIGATSWFGDFADWATALADRVSALAKKYGTVAEAVLTAIDAFRNDPSIANAYALWAAFTKFKDTAEVAYAASGPQVAMSFADWQAAVALLLQLLDAIRQRRAG